MACSKFEYTKKFEADDALLPGVYIVVRVDGRGFSKFTAEHGYVKPNDIRGLALMNHCAAVVMADWGDIVLAFGESDEYSFVLPRTCNVYGRRSAKIATNIASSFAANFVFHWRRYFPDTPLRAPPAFDARCVCYPTLRSVTDYFKWRQVDTHINSLHNEAFWALVNLGGHSNDEAARMLTGTVSEQKHELLHSRFGINYAKLPVLFRRGTTLVRARVLPHAALGASSTSYSSGCDTVAADASDGMLPLQEHVHAASASTNAPAVVNSSGSAGATQDDARRADGPGAREPNIVDSSVAGTEAKHVLAAGIDAATGSIMEKVGTTGESTGFAEVSPPVSGAAVASKRRGDGRRQQRLATRASLPSEAETGGVGGDSDHWGASPHNPGGVPVPPVPLPAGVLMIFPDYLAGDGDTRRGSPPASFLHGVFGPLEE